MKALLASLAVVLTLGAAAAPASADPRWSGGYEQVRDHRHHGGWGDDRGWGRHRELLPERAVARIVYREGFVAIEDIRLRRDRYHVEAVRPNGAVFRLALDARNGRILHTERVGWARGRDHYGPPRHRGIEFRFDFAR